MTHFYPHPSHTSAPAQRRRAWWPSVALAGLLVSSAPAWADDDCEVPAAQWQPRTAVQSMATQRGWQVERAAIYRREPQPLDWAIYQNAQPQAAWITSAELVRLLFDQAPPELVQNLQSLLYLVHHSKIAEALYQAGAKRVQVLERLDKDFLKSLHGAEHR